MSTVYIKPELSCLVSHKKITVADVCQVYAAEEKGADVLLFGHTHEPTDTFIPQGEYNLNKPLHIFNPGSLKEYSYGLCEIRNGEFLFSHGTIY